MLKVHQELSDLLAKAEAVAKKIETGGGNAVGIIHSIRQANTLTGLRIKAYQEAEAAKTAAKK